MNVYNFGAIQAYYPPFNINYTLSTTNGQMTQNTAYELVDEQLYDNTGLGVFYIIPYSVNFLGGGFLINIEDGDGNPLDKATLAATDPNTWMVGAELRVATYEYENDMAELDEPSFITPDAGVRPPNLDLGDVRPPDSNNDDISYNDATQIIAALGATDTDYANLIQGTITLIQELQAEVEAGNTSDVEAESTIASLQAQLDELVGSQGAIQLLINAIGSAAAGTFSTSGATFCSYVAPSPDEPQDPNTGASSGLRNIQNRGTDVDGGDSSPLSNPFTSAVVTDLCDKLTTLNDAVVAQQDFSEAGYNDVQDIINALTAENAAGYADGFDEGVASIDQQALITQGYGEGYQAAEDAIQNFGDYLTTLGAYQGGEQAGFQDAINQLNSTSYGGNADAAVQNLYDAIYDLGAGSVTPEDGISQEDVDNAALDGYSDGFDEGVASVELSDLFDAVINPIPDGISNQYAQSGQAAYDFGYGHGYSAGNTSGMASGGASALVSLNAIVSGLTGGSPSNYTDLKSAALAIFQLGQENVDPASGVTFTNPTTGVQSTGQDAVTAAEQYGYSDGFTQGAASVTPEDGVSQADVDNAVADAEAAAQDVLDGVITQLNQATASNTAYGQFIEDLTSELDILEQFLTSYYGYDRNDPTAAFDIPTNTGENEGYQAYFSGGQAYKSFDPRRLVNMNNFLNFSGQPQVRNQQQAMPRVDDENLELELTPTAKTGLYLLGGGALALLMFKLFKKK